MSKPLSTCAPPFSMLPPAARAVFQDDEKGPTQFTTSCSAEQRATVAASCVFKSAGALLAQQSRGNTSQIQANQLILELHRSAMSPTLNRSENFSASTLSAPSLQPTPVQQKTSSMLDYLQKPSPTQDREKIPQTEEMVRKSCSRGVTDALHKELSALPLECWQYFRVAERSHRERCEQTELLLLKDHVELFARSAAASLREMCQEELSSKRGILRETQRKKAHASFEKCQSVWEKRAVGKECSDNFKQILQRDKEVVFKKLSYALSQASSYEMEEIVLKYEKTFQLIAAEEFEKICIKKQITNVPLSTY